MSTALKEVLNNLSLMLVMTSPGDHGGIEILVSLCEDSQNIAREIGKHARLCAAVDYIKSNSQSDKVLDLIQEFVTASQQYLDNAGNSKFPNEKSTNESAVTLNPDFGDSLDTTFLTEFIETHALLLEDLEGSLTDFQHKGGDPTEATTFVKRYLHNLKGDAGSIGLVGIERVCHELEDLLGVTPLVDMTVTLLSFKEWCSSCLTAFAAGAPPPITSVEFLAIVKGESILSAPQIDEALAITPQTARPESVKLVPAEQNTAEQNRAEQNPVQATPGLAQITPIPPAQTAAPSAGREYQITGEADILLEFAAEAEEHLNNVESVILEASGNFSKDAIDTIFRGIHSLKGGSAYFQLEEMSKCSHILENFLSEVRDGKRTIDAQLNSLLLTYIDLQKDTLSRARSALSKSGKMTTSAQSLDFLRSLDEYQVECSGSKQPSVMHPAPFAAVPKAASMAPTTNPSNQQGAALSMPSPTSSDGEDTEPKGAKLQVKDFVKVDTSRLDHLIDSIGEMVIYSSMLIRSCRELLAENQAVMDSTHRVEKFSRDLQDIGMSMRLVPIKGLFQKMSRLVWDTSKKLGKSIQFEMHGEDTELDRNLIDKLADPLMHMVRNSLDHGVEGPDEREENGKSRSGNVTLRAFHSGGSIHIQIQDDGRGLNPDKILAKAIEKGIVAAGQKLSKEEIYQLIFAPGFSTAAVVTDISGRGVGMDVVRRNVESLRGRIQIQSEVNRGSTFTIELPLTLAIIDGIEIRVGAEHFIVPSLSIIEFVRPKPEMVAAPLDQGETFQFRGKYLPIFRISRLYGIKAEFDKPTESTIIVVENGHELVALMVDEVLGQCSTVIKSLGPSFEEGKGFAGCAIMPSGDVALILDIRSLVGVARSSYRGEIVSIHEELAAIL